MSFNSYQLKYIALITMIIDHATVIFQDVLPPEAYIFFRSIGRFSFPIYCFLLVEGFFHTRNQFRYLGRLTIFAIISELPFDLALYKGYFLLDSNDFRSFFQWEHQNVFFTLAVGFASMMLLDAMKNHFRLRTLAPLAIYIGIFSAEYLRFDYGAAGILTILLFYFYRRERSFPLFICYLPLILLSVSAPIQLACILSILPICSYNGEKGSGPKYLFYLAYPAHFLLLLAIYLYVPVF